MLGGDHLRLELLFGEADSVKGIESRCRMVFYGYRLDTGRKAEILKAENRYTKTKTETLKS